MAFRIGVLIVTVLAGFFVGLYSQKVLWGIDSVIVYPILAFMIGGIFIGLEIAAHQAKGRKVLFGSLGILLGMAIGSYIGDLVVKALFPQLAESFRFIFVLVLAYVGFTLAWLKEEEIKWLGGAKSGSDEMDGELRTGSKILDTSVIIDGRIADIAETGFLEGDLIVPKFVLTELQQVADSSDPLKRSRGRRGLDILNNMKASKKAIIKITEVDFPEVHEVDTKLLKLGNLLQAAVITNDYNLNKVAEFQNVRILNINDLTNAVKPVVLPNEELRITVIKEGKDQNQGIAYLDDGTMVVIDNGRHYIGQDVRVVVTSILQTPAGRMIFTQIGDGKR